MIHRRPTPSARARRARRWAAARPGRPIRYGPWARLSDYLQATRDGRRGVPSADAREAGTPAVRDLVRAFDGAVQHERQRMERDLAPLRAEASELEVVVTAGEDEAARVAELLVGCPEELTATELTQRRSGEGATEPDVVGSRRRRERAAQRAPLLARRDAASARQQAAQSDLAVIKECIDTRQAIGAVRVARLQAYTERRIAAYQRRLLRVHADRDRLLPLLAPVAPQLPAWAEQVLEAPLAPGHGPQPVRELRPVIETGAAR